MRDSRRVSEKRKNSNNKAIATASFVIAVASLLLQIISLIFEIKS